jgi:hypothetical protein
MRCSRLLFFALSFAVWFAFDVTHAMVAAQAFVKYDGKHIQLHTNVGTKADAEDFVAAFDAATQQWAEFWNLSRDTVASWSVDAIVMSDRNAATIAGLMEPRIPDFKFGYASGNTVYVMNQPSLYYTEHLLLHEGVHALALHAFGGRGPTWFMEGTAELMATHRGRGAAVKINQIPASREESPFWGRLKLIRDQRDKKTIPTVETIMKAPPRLDGDVGDYTWSWAASMLLTEYPEYKETFQAMTLAGHDSTNELTRQLYQRLMGNWPVLVARFRLMSHSLDYGFDWERERVAISASDPAWKNEPIRLVVNASQGWQSAGVLFPAGARIAIEATGTCTLANDPKPWSSEPDGVTIRYHDGKPLGRLLACAVPVAYDRSATTLPALDIESVGAGSEIKISQLSWLVLRINDFAGELSDNTGAFSVQVKLP